VWRCIGKGSRVIGQGSASELLGIKKLSLEASMEEDTHWHWCSCRLPRWCIQGVAYGSSYSVYYCLQTTRISLLWGRLIPLSNVPKFPLLEKPHGHAAVMTGRRRQSSFGKLFRQEQNQPRYASSTHASELLPRNCHLGLRTGLSRCRTGARSSLGQD